MMFYLFFSFFSHFSLTYYTYMYRNSSLRSINKPSNERVESNQKITKLPSAALFKYYKNKSIRIHPEEQKHHSKAQYVNNYNRRDNIILLERNGYSSVIYKHTTLSQESPTNDPYSKYCYICKRNNRRSQRIIYKEQNDENTVDPNMQTLSAPVAVRANTIKHNNFCTRCELSFATRKGFRSHLWNKHDLGLSPLKPNQISSKPYH
ncbi:MAG: hypothetical protein EXX96DRAFT_559659 [Benjaminiella poitrasii]|nr:MAG: hypothetical protein EXX96DRAFT_559659 [Benjaminiella poitrasii]